MSARSSSTLSKFSDLPTNVWDWTQEVPKRVGQRVGYLRTLGPASDEADDGLEEPEVGTAGPFPHVEPYQGGWAIRRDGECDPERLFSSREAAVACAYAVAEAGGWPVVIHREDGTIAEIVALL